MYICIYLCIYMYVCTYVVYIYVYVCIYVCMYICMYYVLMYVDMYACTYVCIYLYVRTYVRMYICIFMYFCMYVYELCIYVYVCLWATVHRSTYRLNNNICTNFAAKGTCLENTKIPHHWFHAIIYDNYLRDTSIKESKSDNNWTSSRVELEIEAVWNRIHDFVLRTSLLSFRL